MDGVATISIPFRLRQDNATSVANRRRSPWSVRQNKSLACITRARVVLKRSHSACQIVCNRGCINPRYAADRWIKHGQSTQNVTGGSNFNLIKLTENK